jgi:hypothetical protein
MIVAWLIYDQQTGDIKKVSWREIIGQSIAIDISLALDFMNGRVRLQDWFVTNIPSNPTLAIRPKIATTKLESFCSLIDPCDEYINVQISLQKNLVCITHNDQTREKMLYMTKQNDPSWLITSWDLSKCAVQHNKISLVVKNHHLYSFYLG